MWFCGRRIRAGRSTGRAVDEIVGGGIVNRAFYIILIPAALVAIGYVVVFQLMRGTPPAYWRLILPFAFVGGTLWWFGRTVGRKKSSGAQ